MSLLGSRLLGVRDLFSLGPRAVEDLAAILQVSVVHSPTSQSTPQSMFLEVYENAEATKATTSGDRGDF